MVLRGLTWMTPPPRLPLTLVRKASGRPIILPIQSSMMVSSSVQAGEAAQEKPTQPMASPSMSPRIDGYELPAGKYAWNCGCCQCVT